MAFDYQKKKEDEENTVGQGTNPYEATGPSVSPTEPQSAQGQPGAGTKSGSFVNLQSYLDANRSGGFAESFGGKLNQSADIARDKTQAAENQFRGNVDQGSLRFDDDLKGGIASDPTSLSDEQKQKAYRLRDENYGGPIDFSTNQNYSDLRGYLDSVKEKSDLSSSVEGRKALLGQEYGGKPVGYSSGQKTLDQMLVNAPEKRGVFNAASDNLKQASNNYSTLQSALDNYASQAKSGSEAAKADYQKAVNDPATAMATELEAKAAQRRNEATQNAATLSSALKGSKNLSSIDPNVLQMLGGDTSALNTQGLSTSSPWFNEASWLKAWGGQPVSNEVAGSGSFYGVDPSKYLSTVSADKIHAGSVASQEQAARLKALEDLSGTANPYVANIDQAGSFDDEPLNNYNYQDFGTAVNSQRSGLNSELEALNNLIKSQPGITNGAGIPVFQQGLAELKKRYGLA